MERKTAVAAHALIKKGNKYLVTQRSELNDYKPHYWDIPGGTIRFGERVNAALKREVREEVNLVILPEKVLFVYGNHEPKLKTHHFQIVYLAKYKSGSIKLNPKEHSNYQWLSLNEIKNIKTIAFLKSLLKEI